LIYLDV